MHTLITEQLGVRDARVVGHDLGAAVAFQYAAQFPEDTELLGYLDLPLPGPASPRPSSGTTSALAAGGSGIPRV